MNRGKNWQKPVASSTSLTCFIKCFGMLLHSVSQYLKRIQAGRYLYHRHVSLEKIVILALRSSLVVRKTESLNSHIRDYLFLLMLILHLYRVQEKWKRMAKNVNVKQYLKSSLSPDFCPLAKVKYFHRDFLMHNISRSYADEFKLITMNYLAYLVRRCSLFFIFFRPPISGTSPVVQKMSPKHPISLTLENL